MGLDVSNMESNKERSFLDPTYPIRLLGGGEMGGKAHGLASIRAALHQAFAENSKEDFQVDIPIFAVVGTNVFDAFMRENRLYEMALSGVPDEQLARAFLAADLPFEVLGELRAISDEMHTPLAVRSSSLLEDAVSGPFAGIYETKMIPNDQFDPDKRSRQLIEAIKLVYASTFFEKARDYRRVIGQADRAEKMAVIIQKIVGKTYRQRFYPELSGVARSYNYYPVKPATPEEGIVNLALGLGKTIVDGGVSWTYSPAHPNAVPPYRSAEEILDLTQNKFWAVNMGEPVGYDPIGETEYMLEESLPAAEEDGTLRYLVSTYDVGSERLVIGMGSEGPRALTFAPILVVNRKPLNAIITRTLALCEKELGSPVEIEFAATFDPDLFYVLQVRPMVVPSRQVRIERAELESADLLLAGDNILGNGEVENIKDIVFVKPSTFDLKHTQRMVPELEKLNHLLLDAGTPYLLIVLGRLGTTDPWLGIPASWGQVCGAKVVVEVAQENVNVELSQGSHYFHNIINLGVLYFCMKPGSSFKVDWDWLVQQPHRTETEFLRHIALEQPLQVKVDGKQGLGFIRKPKGSKKQ